MNEETIPQMRERIDRLEKSEKDLKSQNGDLSKENTKLKARDLFREAEYPAAYGDLFAGQIEGSDEVTPEAVQTFIESYDLSKDGSPATGDSSTDDEGNSESEQKEKNVEGLELLSRSGSRSGEGGTGSSSSETLTREEYMDLARNDPNAAKVAVSQGRVQVSRDNPYVPSQGRVSGANPYAPSSE